MEQINKNKEKEKNILELKNILQVVLEELEETQQNLNDCKRILSKLQKALIDSPPNIFVRLKKYFNK